MENKLYNKTWKLEVYGGITYLWVAGSEGIEGMQGLGWECRNGKNGKPFNGSYRDYYEDPFLHPQL